MWEGASDLDRVLALACARYQEGETTAIDDVYDDLIDFGLRVCSRTCGKYIDPYDEEASIARLAILESFASYDASRGRFLVFFGQVIKNRIIDFKRREKKHSAVPISALAAEGDFPEIKADEDLIENIIEDLARKKEINEYKKILAEFSISFEDLVLSGPKQFRSRERAKDVARQIAGDKQMADYLLEKKVLPAKDIQEKYLVNKKNPGEVP
jgi:RNA polymerase sigma factor